MSRFDHRWCEVESFMHMLGGMTNMEVDGETMQWLVMLESYVTSDNTLQL